jgi:hypothetical protein
VNAADTEKQIASFIEKYAPPIQAQLRDARRRLRSFFPRGFELVFDNYNALVCGISLTERSSGAFISIAGYPRWVTLFFLNRVDLTDPNRLLTGEGKRVRGIRLAESAQMSGPEIAALIAQSALPHQAELQAAPPLTTIITTVAAKQRPRHPPVFGTIDSTRLAKSPRIRA